MTYAITKKHGTYNRSYHYGSYKYIVVHYTGSGTSKKGAAKANCIYFGGGNRKSSAHYFVDDGSIYEYLDPSKYYAWHCGDGNGAYGITNANSIGIEVCLNGDNPYTDKEIARVTWLVQYLMKRYNIKPENIVRHYDASRKMCPYYYAKLKDKWTALRKQLIGGTTTNVSLANLEVDGIEGPATIKALQKALGVSISGTKNAKTIKALQKFLNKKKYNIVIDGKQGVATNTALQKFLRTKGYLIKVSGEYDFATISALQKCLNAGSFK